MISDNLIYDLLYSPSRRNHVFFTPPINIQSLDVGHLVSTFISQNDDQSSLPLKVIEFLDREFYGEKRVLILDNPGILLEPQLQINFPMLLERYSRSQVLIIQWPGEIALPWIFFLSKTDGVSIDVSSVNPQLLPSHLAHEI